MKEKMLEIIKEAEFIENMSAQDLKKFMIETYEFFDPVEFDEIQNQYIYKCGLLAGKLTILKSCIEEM